MANLTVPIQVNLPDDWVDQVVNRLRNDTDAEWATVVRCKDCKYGQAHNPDGSIICEHWDDNAVSGDDFCSRAERKE